MARPMPWLAPVTTATRSRSASGEKARRAADPGSAIPRPSVAAILGFFETPGARRGPARSDDEHGFGSFHGVAGAGASARTVPTSRCDGAGPAARVSRLARGFALLDPDRVTPLPSAPPADRDAARRWIVLGTVWVTLAITFGLYFSFPVFLVPLFEEFGWSRGATAAAFSISSIVQGLLSPGVGVLVDRFGPRRIILGGAALLGGSCLLSSRIDSLWSLYLVVGVLAAAGACAVGWVPSGVLIARWF